MINNEASVKAKRFNLEDRLKDLIQQAINESNELISVFVKSVETAQSNLQKSL